MKHGIVTNGRTTTFYGNAATMYVVRQAIASCFTLAEVEERLKNASSVMRPFYIEEALRQKWKISAELFSWMEEDDKRQEEEQKKIIHKNIVRYLASSTKKKAKSRLSIPCFLCGGEIKGGQEYHAVTYDRKAYRGHKECVAKEPKK